MTRVDSIFSDTSALVFLLPFTKKLRCKRFRLCAFLPEFPLGGKVNMYELTQVSERVKELRKKVGKTQEQISEELGMNIKTYRAIETGARVGKIDTLCLLADYFHTSLDYLTGKDEVMQEDFVMRVRNLPSDKQMLARQLIASILDTLSA